MAEELEERVLNLEKETHRLFFELSTKIAKLEDLIINNTQSQTITQPVTNVTKGKEKLCPVCGLPIDSRRRNVVYCSDSCKQVACRERKAVTKAEPEPAKEPERSPAGPAWELQKAREPEKEHSREKPQKTTIERQEGKTYNVVCQNCSREFAAKSTKAKYCSDACNQAAYRNRKK